MLHVTWRVSTARYRKKGSKTRAAEELEAQHLQQSAMETASTNPGEPDDAATAEVRNLKAYAFILDVEFPSAHLAALSGGLVSTF
ncbi:hypothetical protein [Bradyrhizobium sp. URHD0069]|uniref:hypothetical protein n=1 Tax=Bradyrhizobium sp. URHD0069 TaxID=1380355 RepID=UPI0005634369|nr:hypothetical protein [Bradyrhizobium sp. URHD0069]